MSPRSGRAERSRQETRSSYDDSDVADSINSADSVDEIRSSGIQNVSDEGVAGGIGSGAKLLEKWRFQKWFLGGQKVVFDALRMVFWHLSAPYFPFLG